MNVIDIFPVCVCTRTVFSMARLCGIRTGWICHTVLNSLLNFDKESAV